MAMSSLRQPEPDLNERLDSFLQWYHTTDPSDRGADAMASAFDEALDGFDLQSMSQRDLETIAPFAAFSPSVQPLVRKLLEEQIVRPGADGARAAFLDLRATGVSRVGEPAEVAEALRRLVEHPGFHEAWVAGNLSQLPGVLGHFPRQAAQQASESILAVRDLFDESSSPTHLGLGVRYLLSMHAFGHTIPLHEREKFRVRLVSLFEAAAEQDMASEKHAWIQSKLDQLKSPAGRGQILGARAKEISFAWSSDPSIRSLADTRGMVVVIDFWETWCGPCIASFPSVRQLVEHYEGFEVIVLGVASEQRERGKERLAQFYGDFAEKHNMNWTVAIADENIFELQYAIKGIPHVALIDPSGVLRHNALHPGNSLTETTALIDPILREFGLDAPKED